MRGLLRVFSAVAACILAAGCVPDGMSRGTRIDDAKFVSVEAATHRHQYPGRPEETRTVLRVHFATATDLVAFARSRDRYIGVTIIPCRVRSDGGYMKAYYFDLQGVYDWFGELARNPKAQEARAAAGGDGGDYVFYIAAEAPPSTSAYANYASYDLKAQPEDMCARIHGGMPNNLLWLSNPPAFVFETNEIVVPGDTIRAALASDKKN